MDIREGEKDGYKGGRERCIYARKRKMYIREGDKDGYKGGREKDGYKGGRERWI